MLWVGTSGWQYAHWRGALYPPRVPTSEWLALYAQAFPTVETNVTFYRLPAPEVFAQWARRLPPDYVVAVKASRFLTHMKRLHEPREPVERLLRHAAPLGTRLGPVLVQLPPDLRAAPDRLDETLAAFGGRVRVAVEPRHPSWFTDEVRSVLARRGAVLCWADRESRPVTPLWSTSDWAYLRLHAGRGRPRGCYGRAALASWVDRLQEHRDHDVFVYFNNDGDACAIRDARTFVRMAERAGFTTPTTSAVARARADHRRARSA
jgi:uncharacterized protein YecE (DUF72 family)